MKKIVLSCLVIFTITSCVSQQQYQDLESNYYRALDDQSNTSKDLTLANLKIENLEKDLELAKNELYVKDTALSNSRMLIKQSQKEHEGNLQELYSALNSSGEKSKLFYNQLAEKENIVNDLSQKVKDLEEQIDAKNAEIFDLKRQILTLEINQKVSEATATPEKKTTTKK